MSALVRPLRTEDLRVVAELHRSELPVGFFPTLGPRFLRTYHATYLHGPHGAGLVAELEGRVVGFVVGSTDAAAHGAWTARSRGLRLALAGAGALLVRPGALRTFVTTRLGRYARGLLRRLRPARTTAGAAASGPPAASPAVLVHVAVADTARGHGLGARLVTDFVAQCQAAGAPEVRLVTDADGAAVAFYDHLGWTRGGERPATDGRAVVEFRSPQA